MAQSGGLPAHRGDHSRLCEEGQRNSTSKAASAPHHGTTRPPARRNIRPKSSSAICRCSLDAAKATAAAAAATANPTPPRSISAVPRRIILNPPKSPTTTFRSDRCDKVFVTFPGSPLNRRVFALYSISIFRSFFLFGMTWAAAAGRS